MTSQHDAGLHRRALTRAGKVLRAALAERPNDARLLNALGWVELNAIDQKERTPSELEAIASKLAPMAKTAAELDLLAWNTLSPQ